MTVSQEGGPLRPNKDSKNGKTNGSAQAGARIDLSSEPRLPSLDPGLKKLVGNGHFIPISHTYLNAFRDGRPEKAIPDPLKLMRLFEKAGQYYEEQVIQHENWKDLKSADRGEILGDSQSIALMKLANASAASFSLLERYLHSRAREFSRTHERFEENPFQDLRFRVLHLAARPVAHLYTWADDEHRPQTVGAARKLLRRVSQLQVAADEIRERFSQDPSQDDRGDQRSRLAS